MSQYSCWNDVLLAGNGRNAPQSPSLVFSLPSPPPRDVDQGQGPYGFGPRYFRRELEPVLSEACSSPSHRAWRIRRGRFPKIIKQSFEFRCGSGRMGPEARFRAEQAASSRSCAVPLRRSPGRPPYQVAGRLGSRNFVFRRQPSSNASVLQAVRRQNHGGPATRFESKPAKTATLFVEQEEVDETSCAGRRMPSSASPLALGGRGKPS